MGHAAGTHRARPGAVRTAPGCAVRFMRACFVLAALLSLPVSAWPFSMELPVNCTGADLCLPQNYFDHDPK